MDALLSVQTTPWGIAATGMEEAYLFCGHRSTQAYRQQEPVYSYHFSKRQTEQVSKRSADTKTENTERIEPVYSERHNRCYEGVSMV
jgi:hypothetical protein